MRTRKSFFAALVCVLALGLAPVGASALPSSKPDSSAFVTNGTVNAIARGNGLTYIGGDFTQLRAQTGGFARLSPSTGRRFVSSPEVVGQVWASAPDGAGGAYIGGLFTRVGNVGRQNIAHVLADGSVDPAFNPGANAIVRTLAVSGGAVYAGGDFNGANSIGGLARNRIAKLSATSGNAFLDFDPDADNIVETIAVSGNEVYAGGSFLNIGGQARSRIAKVSATSGNAFPTFNPNANDTVAALVASGGVVYAGGSFTNIGGAGRSRLAKLSATSGNAFSAWNTVADAAVSDLAIANGALYAGGNFTEIDSLVGGVIGRRHLVKMVATSGEALESFNANVSPGGNVRGITVSGNEVYVGGFFTSIGGQARNRIAKLSTSSGNAFSSFNPNADDVVRTFAVSGSSVFAGGSFTSLNPVTRNRIAALDANGIPTAFNPNSNGIVRALAVDGSGVYSGGDFTEVGGRTRNGIAKLSAASGNAFSGFNPNAAGGNVAALAVSGSSVFAGGNFTDIGGTPRLRIAKLSATSGNAFSGFNPTANAPVRAIVVSGSSVYAAGEFTDRITKLSASSGNAFTGFDANPNGFVDALAIDGSVLYAGGDFTNIGGLARNRIAKLSATSGNAVSAWNPNPDGTVVRALALSGSALYAGGTFANIGGAARSLVGALSTTSGNAFSFAPNAAGGGIDVRALAASASGLYAGGSFTNVGGPARQGYAQFTGP